ncbi:MAG: hypothetical protein ABR956_00060 [Terracidiphilus sp.]|jgi:hypothetical protein
MSPYGQPEPGQSEILTDAFREQLLACLDECASGRKGLFFEPSRVSADEVDSDWCEAARLRELALAIQGILSQSDERNALCDEFLDLCSIHGESDPGERKLARAFLQRIEKGEVGTPTQQEIKPW